jgi:EmrB/QacA subfamily drug resistance transporter
VSNPPVPPNRLLLVALLACTFLTALDILVVATAMPTIVAQLGGVALYSWVFSSYLLASTVTVPVYGKLADIYGRKPIFTLGTSVFLLGSVLCGLSQDMTQLVASRAVQGIGAGAVFPVTLTIVGDQYPLEQRARITALFSATWGVAGIIGPLIGGFLTDYWSWRWIFFLNLPVGAVALAMLWWLLHERIERRPHQIDYLGAALLTVALTALMIGLLDAGTTFPAVSFLALGLFGTAALLLGLFYRQERTAPEPILPLELLGRRLILVAGLCVMLCGVVNSGVATFVPVFAQGVLGGTATMAGAVLMPTSFTWTAGTFISGRLLLRFGYRPIALLGGSVLAAGAGLLVLLDGTSPLWAVLAAVGVAGFGMGLTVTNLTIVSQSSVPWGQRGVVTSIGQFFRSIGQMLGVTSLGAVFTLGMNRQLADVGEDIGIANVILDPLASRALDPSVLLNVRDVLDNSLEAVFVVVALAAAVNVVLTAQLPRGSAADLAWTPPTSASRDAPESARADT